MYCSLVQTVFILYGISHVCGFIGLLTDQCVHFRMQPLPSDPTQWIEQRLDHFNDSDSRTWKMKYYKIMKSWKPEGPLLLYFHGGFPLPPPNVTMTMDQVQEMSNYYVDKIAEEVGAAYFMLEHRYYGDSLPIAEPTTEDLIYLTSRQALADAVHLLTTIKKTAEFQNSKVIIVGGFYAGNLAIWMKQLYPDLIDAVLSSSAPVLAKTDFSEFAESITDTYRTYGSEECVTNITENLNNYREMFKTSEGIEKLMTEFFICEDNDMTILENQQFFFFAVLAVYQEDAEYGTFDDIKAICQDLNSGQLEHRLPVVENYGPSFCRIFDYNLTISLLNEIPTYRFWSYQLCNEFGHFTTTSSNKQMFGKSIPMEFHISGCKYMFGEEFNRERIEQGVINTNRMYGGLTPNVTNVMFVNGDMDPWHKIGIVHDLSDDAPAIFIKGSGHCHDFYPHLNDSDNLKEARKRILNLLKKWIGQA